MITHYNDLYHFTLAIYKRWWQSIIISFIHWLQYIIILSLSCHHISEFCDVQVSMCIILDSVNITLYFFRTKEQKNHLFIHLNLCIALALGLVVFIAGIERATDNEASVTAIVISMLTVPFQYLGCLQGCSCPVAVFLHICFLLDVVWRSNAVHDVSHCLR